MIITGFAGLKLLLHLIFNRGYGYHGDELYFIACGKHLAFGYVDHGPWVPWMARLSEELFGQGLAQLRFLPALMGAITMALVGVMTWRLGGKEYAVLIACLSFLIAPVYLLPGNILSLPSFEPFFWSLAALILIRIIQTGNSKLWLWAGLVLGIGLLNKHSELFYIFGIFVGLALTPQRRELKSPWLWGGVLIALFIFSLNLWWQVENGWPTLEFLRNLNQSTMSRISLFEFLMGQFFYVHPMNALIWVSGLGFFLFASSGKPYRILGWAYLSVLAILVVAKGKIYYLGPAYPMLFAGGATAIEAWMERHQSRWLKMALPSIMILGGIGSLPMGLPIMPIQKLDDYVKKNTFGTLQNAYELTGTFHDQFGWENLVAETAHTYNTLSEEEKQDCVILADNFSLAGAIDLFGKAHGLPNAICGGLTYYLWGPGEKNGRIAVAVGSRMELLNTFYGDVQIIRTAECEECSPYYKSVPIYLCRDARATIQEAWKEIRPYAYR